MIDVSSRSSNPKNSVSITKSKSALNFLRGPDPFSFFTAADRKTITVKKVKEIDSYIEVTVFQNKTDNDEFIRISNNLNKLIRFNEFKIVKNELRNIFQDRKTSLVVKYHILKEMLLIVPIEVGNSLQELFILNGLEFSRDFLELEENKIYFTILLFKDLFVSKTSFFNNEVKYHLANYLLKQADFFHPDTLKWCECNILENYLSLIKDIKNNNAKESDLYAFDCLFVFVSSRNNFESLFDPKSESFLYFIDRLNNGKLSFLLNEIRDIYDLYKYIPNEFLKFIQNEDNLNFILQNNDIRDRFIFELNKIEFSSVNVSSASEIEIEFHEKIFDKILDLSIENNNLISVVEKYFLNRMPYFSFKFIRDVYSKLDSKSKLQPVIEWIIKYYLCLTGLKPQSEILDSSFKLQNLLNQETDTSKNIAHILNEIFLDELDNDPIQFFVIKSSNEHYAILEVKNLNELRSISANHTTLDSFKVIDLVYPLNPRFFTLTDYNTLSLPRFLNPFLTRITTIADPVANVLSSLFFDENIEKSFQRKNIIESKLTKNALNKIFSQALLDPCERVNISKEFKLEFSSLLDNDYFLEFFSSMTGSIIENKKISYLTENNYPEVKIRLVTKYPTHLELKDDHLGKYFLYYEDSDKRYRMYYVANNTKVRLSLNDKDPTIHNLCRKIHTKLTKIDELVLNTEDFFKVVKRIEISDLIQTAKICEIIFENFSEFLKNTPGKYKPIVESLSLKFDSLFNEMRFTLQTKDHLKDFSKLDFYKILSLFFISCASTNIFGVHDENKNESIVFFRFLAAYCLESYVNQLNPIDEAGHKDKDFMHQVAMRCILTSDCAEVLLNNLSLYFYTDVLRITHTQLT